MMIVPAKTNEVRKSEALLKARHELGELAIKLISIIYSNVKRSDEPGKEYHIRVSDIADLLNVKYGEIYNKLKESVSEMLQSPVLIEDENTKEWVAFNWISDAIYKDGVITFSISKRLKPYILDLQNNFLKYKLENILQLKGTYTIRLYEILKDELEINSRYGKKSEKIISLSDFREQLQIPKSYQYGNSSGIKKRIIEKSQIQFAKYTDITFDYEEIKTGRKVTHLKFIIKPNTKKLKDSSNKYENYFKSRKNFVSLLRENYKGHEKTFGYKTVNGSNYWLKIDNKGLVYGVGKDVIEFNAVKSAEIYDLWLKIAQNSELYQQLIINKECIRNLDNDIRTHLFNEVKNLKEQGLI